MLIPIMYMLARNMHGNFMWIVTSQGCTEEKKTLENLYFLNGFQPFACGSTMTERVYLKHVNNYFMRHGEWLFWIFLPVSLYVILSCII